MKKTLIFLVLFLVFSGKEFKAQTWEWATLLEGTLGATDHVIIKGIDTDMSGNSYVTGYYTGQLNSVAINTSSQQDGFVAKFDATGVLQWAYKFGGVGDDAGNAISVETYTGTNTPGAFYITGYVQYNDPSNVTFNGAGTPTSMPSVTSCSASPPPNNIYLQGGLSSKQIFVAKYDINGNVKWIRPVYSPSSYDGEGLGISSSFHHTNTQNYEKNVFVTGYFEGSSLSFMKSATCTFTTVNGNTNNKTAFVAKLSGSNGSAIWAESMAVPANANAMSIGKNIVLDGATALGYIPGGGLFITGDYEAAANIGGTNISNTTGFTRAYVAHLRPGPGTGMGSALWVTEIQSAGANANVQARDIYGKHANFDELFALGDFSGSSITSGTASATNGGGRDMYLIKMTKTTGVASIAKAEGGLDDQYAYGMDISSGGGVGGNSELFVSGAYNNSISFSGGPSFSSYGSTSNDHYVSKYDLNLNNICATHWDASMNLYTHTLDACDVAVSKENANGSSYLGGMFLSSENPGFNPIPGLATSKPVSSYISKWICCDCPPPTITSVNRPFPGGTATVNFSYPPCDNPSGQFFLVYESIASPSTTVPVTWGSASYVIPPGLQAYPVIYTWVTQNGCSVRSNIIMAKATSINEINSNDIGVTFNVYPNPSGNTINFDANYSGSIEIYNILGVLVKTAQLNGSFKMNMNVSDLPSGNYVCKFISEDHTVTTRKIQIEH